MAFRHDPANSLADIVENAGRPEDYIANMDQAAFERSGVVRDAVERCIERFCEAVYRPGSRAAEFLPEQSIGDIRGMGNRLRHAYDKIEGGVIWNAARYDVPGLAADARKALARLEQESQRAEP